MPEQTKNIQKDIEITEDYLVLSPDEITKDKVEENPYRNRRYSRYRSSRRGWNHMV